MTSSSGFPDFEPQTLALTRKVEPENIFGNYDKTYICAKESNTILNGNSVFFPALTGERCGMVQPFRFCGRTNQPDTFSEEESTSLPGHTSDIPRTAMPPTRFQGMNRRINQSTPSTQTNRKSYVKTLKALYREV